jgi:hypothetical protein
MSAPSAFTIASASWASIKATPGKASAPFSGAGKSASCLGFFPTAGLPCGPCRRQPGLRPTPDMHRLYTTGPATAATVDRSQDVEINGLDIPRRIINESMGAIRFRPRSSGPLWPPTSSGSGMGLPRIWPRWWPAWRP